MKNIDLKNIQLDQSLLVRDVLAMLVETLGISRSAIYDLISMDGSSFSKEKQAKTLAASGGILKAKLNLLSKVATYLNVMGLRSEVMLYAIKFSLMDEDGFPELSAMDTIRELKTNTEIDIDKIELSIDSGIKHFSSFSVNIKKVGIVQREGKVEVSYRSSQL